MKWTLCSERLPRGSEIVLVTVPEHVDEDGTEYYAGVCCAYVIETAASGVMWFRSDGAMVGELGRLVPDPVAWMPKPKPYGTDEPKLVRRCYNCAKFFDHDRTCFSDGDCEWFEP